MNILHISSTDLAGGRFTGYYMQQGVGPSHFVSMAVWNRTTTDPQVHSLCPSQWLRSPVSVLRKIDQRLGLEGLSGIGGWTLPLHKVFRHADVVHLHLIHDGPYFSILSLPWLTRLKPTIWTLHDPWPATGGCIHSFDCEKWLTGCAGRCPYPRGASQIQQHCPSLHWLIKKWMYKRSELNLVVASKWMQQRVQRSPLLGHFGCSLIPFGIDLDVFRPISKLDARKILGIPSDQQIIAFRDSGPTDRFKGMPWVMEALLKYSPMKPTSLIILQDGNQFRSLSNKYNVITPGWIDGRKLAIILSAADVFLMPSLQEAFGLMAVESMACGTPVIVFDGTALPDVIEAPNGGIAVPRHNSDALANAIRLLMEDDSLRDALGGQARNIAEQEYGFNVYCERHLKLYETVIERHKQVHK